MKQLRKLNILSYQNTHQEYHFPESTNQRDFGGRQGEYARILRECKTGYMCRVFNIQISVTHTTIWER